LLLIEWQALEQTRNFHQHLKANIVTMQNKRPPLRAAILGCGRVSRTAHYSALGENEDFEFIAVCDSDVERANKWAARNSVKAYSDFNEMLAAENLDFVSINTPNGTHPTFGIDAAMQGVNVMCEKPLGMNLDEVDELIATCKNQKVHLFTVLQNRFNATNQLLKRAIEKNRFGKIHKCTVTVRWARGLEYYTEDHGWRGSKKMAGGVFTNQSVHYIDTMQWLINSNPVSIYAAMDTAVHPVEVETHGSGIIRFSCGAIGTLDLTVLTHPDDREGSIVLMGENGTVKIGGKSMNKILEWDFQDDDPEDDHLAKNSDYEPPTVYGFGHQEIYRRIGKLIRHGEKINVPDGLEGRKSLEILSALYQSAGSNKVITL
jgi:UDP-N-acetyl-2-amino-2-deoxyglucuronate dehydrogenase